MSDQTSDEDQEEAHQTEPERMSWFVFAFMSMCVFMTAVMAYYAWGVFQDAV